MILCCGEALIDMIPVDTQDGSAFLPKPGGAIFNTAIGLGRLGARSGFLSGISTDLFGQQLLAALTASGVDTSLVIQSERPTTLAFVTLVDGQARYAFYDEETAGRMLNAHAVPSIPHDVSALYFGGISLISEPAADFYAALAVSESGRRVIMLDPNIRAAFVSDEPAYRARLDRLVAHADIVKVSDEDLAWMVHNADTDAERARALLERGPALVIVTRGGDGATAYNHVGELTTVAARPARVVDTVGAGDTFNAGVLAHLDRVGALSKDAVRSASESLLRDALALGADVAAITVSRAGANPPWAEELAGRHA